MSLRKKKATASANFNCRVDPVLYEKFKLRADELELTITAILTEYIHHVADGGDLINAKSGPLPAIKPDQYNDVIKRLTELENNVGINRKPSHEYSVRETSAKILAARNRRANGSFHSSRQD